MTLFFENVVFQGDDVSFDNAEFEQVGSRYSNLNTAAATTLTRVSSILRNIQHQNIKWLMPLTLM